MKIVNALIKPPSLVSQLEGKALESMSKKIEEVNAKVLETNVDKEKEPSQKEDTIIHNVNILL